jgi:hypothetical protein
MKKILFICLAVGTILNYSCSTDAKSMPTPPPVKETVVPDPEMPDVVTARITTLAVSDIMVNGDVKGECAGKGHKEVRYSIFFETDYETEKPYNIDVNVWDCGDTEVSTQAIANYKKLIGSANADMEVVLQRRDNAYYPTVLRTEQKIIPSKEGNIAKLQPAVDLWKE